MSPNHFAVTHLLMLDDEHTHHFTLAQVPQKVFRLLCVKYKSHLGFRTQLPSHFCLSCSFLGRLFLASILQPATLVGVALGLKQHRWIPCISFSSRFLFDLLGRHGHNKDLHTRSPQLEADSK